MDLWKVPPLQIKNANHLSRSVGTVCDLYPSEQDQLSDTIITSPVICSVLSKLMKKVEEQESTVKLISMENNIMKGMMSTLYQQQQLQQQQVPITSSTASSMTCSTNNVVTNQVHQQQESSSKKEESSCYQISTEKVLHPVRPNSPTFVNTITSDAKMIVSTSSTTTSTRNPTTPVTAQKIIPPKLLIEKSTPPSTPNSDHNTRQRSANSKQYTPRRVSFEVPSLKKKSQYSSPRESHSHRRCKSTMMMMMPLSPQQRRELGIHVDDSKEAFSRKERVTVYTHEPTTLKQL